MTEEDKLLELAEKATPGRWVATDNADVVGFLGSGAVIDIAHVNPFEEMLHAQAYANAAFIATCSPETIKALVEGKQRAEAALQKIASIQVGWNKPHKPTTARQMVDDCQIIARAALTKNGVSA